MFNLFNSEAKDKIFNYLINKPNSSIKEISNNIKLNYKYIYKILNEFENKKIINKNNKGKYFISNEYIHFLKNKIDNLIKNYSSTIHVKNNLDLYNVLINFYPEDSISKKIDILIENWLLDKLNDWYEKYYDPENKEYEKIKEIISNKFKSNKLNILEVGCGTGRITKKLTFDFSKITAIDKEKSYIDYCKKNLNFKNLKLFHNDIDNFKSYEKFDVIIFSWIGLHYQKNIDQILENIKNNLLKKGSLVIILDAYYDTEYIRILQMLREENLDIIKLKKESLNTRIIKLFKNFKEEILFTYYDFKNTQNFINNFKIELTLEESFFWTKEQEEKIKNYLLNKKENKYIVEEGLWISYFSNN
jgi:SAM-dependent methyltransferase